MKKKGLSSFILLLSCLCMMAMTFLLDFGQRKETSYTYFGFPAEWLGVHGQGDFSFKIWGFLFNLIFYYLIIVGLIKITKLIFNRSNNLN